MANQDAAFGLRPYRHLSGGVIRSEAYSIASGFSTSIFAGDPVLSSGTGRNIQIGLAGGNLLGVFNGVQYVDTNGDQIYRRFWPANTVATEVIAYVYSDALITFIGQAATGQQIDEADVNLLADLSSGTGDTRTGQSAWEVGGHDSTEAQVKILGLQDIPGNAFGEHAVVEIQINEHELGGGSLIEV